MSAVLWSHKQSVSRQDEAREKEIIIRTIIISRKNPRENLPERSPPVYRNTVIP